MEIIKKEYKGWKIYSPKNMKDLSSLGEKIIEKKYKILEILKDTKRNYVAKIEIDNKIYILKGFGSEVIIPQRRIQTIFKDGEALTTLKNGWNAIEIGIAELVKPLVAVVKKKITIQESFLLMEYITGDRLRTNEDIDEVIKIAKKIHSLNRYHGDLNTSNFIKTENGLKMIDTQIKEEKLFWFKRSYDIFTLEEDLLVIYLQYDVEKNYQILKKDIGYYIAKGLKKFKKLKLIAFIKKKKKTLRKRGWKI